MFRPAEIVGEGFPIPTRPPISAAYGAMHGVLGLYLTNKCNMRCAHCCTDSSPDSSTLLDPTCVLGELEEACAARPIAALHVSGGEPFLQPSLLRAIGEQAQRRNLSYAINTNAFWARSLSRAEAVIAEVPGLTQLVLSADEYHEPFQSSERVGWAAAAGVELGVHVQICFCTAGGQETELVSRILSSLTEPVRQRISVAIVPVELGGRADELPEAHWRRLTDEFPEGPCSLVNRPVVLEDGTVQACCNTTLREELCRSPLHLGQMPGQALGTLLARGARDPLIRALRFFGPAFLAEQLSEKQQAQLREPMPKGDICSLCTRIVSKPELVEDLRTSLTNGRASRLLNLAEALSHSSPSPAESYATTP